jgi:hypothetical protein
MRMDHTSYKKRWNNVPAKALSEPVNTIAPTDSSASASSNAWFSSANKGVLNAFKTLGLFRVMSATDGSGREVRMLVNVDMRRSELLANLKRMREPSRRDMVFVRSNLYMSRDGLIFAEYDSMKFSQNFKNCPENIWHQNFESHPNWDTLVHALCL